MGIFDRLKSPSSGDPDGKYVVEFAGGMGAQILSAAIYFHAQSRGEDVRAELRYFDQPENLAADGNKGVGSHRGWALDAFGLPQSGFDADLSFGKKEIKKRVPDGVEKFRLALEALDHAAVRKRFPIPGDVADLLPADFTGPFLCLHVRRGDYLNVASHLLGDEELASSAIQFADLVANVVVVSDSPISPSLKTALDPHFAKLLCLDAIDAFASHRIMRAARILVCSNSQFSLIAALLNRRALSILPKQWFGGGDREIEVPINARCGFQILSGARTD